VPIKIRPPRQSAGSARAIRRALIGQLAGVVASADEFPAVVSFADKIARIERRRRERKDSDHVLPGFIDLQVNGACGIDVMSATADDLLELSHCLAHEGTTGWLPTVITSPLDTIERIDGVIAEAMAAQAESELATGRGSRMPLGAAILGMHLEGPFISPKRLGVHPPLNLPPRGDALDRVVRLRTLKLITLAPELDGALDAIRMLQTRGVAVSIGHTDATYEQAMAGLNAGARMFTHVFNAMPPLHHRAIGTVGAALSHSKAKFALIPDGIHVDQCVLRIAHKAGNLGDLVYTTDRVALACTHGREMPLFGGLVKNARIADGAARRPDGTLAGSTITMLDAARFGWNRAGLSWHGIASAAAGSPAIVLGLADRGRIVRGARADLILLDAELNLKGVFVGGREID
jgi:N-acetylglucosamine-6-phosphate deacetylase